MDKRAEIFKINQENYLKEIAGYNLKPRAEVLGLEIDGDEDFPANTTVLFQKSGEYYLDTESLAMTGALLATRLKQMGG